ncbi:MAG: prepilin-type N-terminal cleavage/methylation domain-containing protein, partial [Candidatus Brocadiia bacterium]
FLRRLGGFTLIEMIIVMVILSLAAMMIVPMLSSAGSVQVGSAANALAGDLEYAKSMAITRGKYYSVVFDKNNERYWITDEAGTVIKDPISRKDYLRDLPAEGLDKVDIVSADFDGTSAIKFDYLGSPYNASGAALLSGVVTLEASGCVITVGVEPVTGLVTISE